MTPQNPDAAPVLPEDKEGRLPGKELDDAQTLPHSRTFQGMPLNVFSYRRYEAAEALGLQFLSQIKLAVEGMAPGGPLYPGQSRDAAMVVWLCTLKDHEVYKVHRSQDWALSKISDFGEKHGVRFGNDAWKELNAVFEEIMMAYFQSVSKPKGEAEPGKPEEEPETDQNLPPLVS